MKNTVSRRELLISGIKLTIISVIPSMMLASCGGAQPNMYGLESVGMSKSTGSFTGSTGSSNFTGSTGPSNFTGSTGITGSKWTGPGHSPMPFYTIYTSPTSFVAPVV